MSTGSVTTFVTRRRRVASISPVCQEDAIYSAPTLATRVAVPLSPVTSASAHSSA